MCYQGHALSVGIQHTALIGLAVNTYFYFLHFMHNYSITLVDHLLTTFFKTKILL